MRIRSKAVLVAFAALLALAGLVENTRAQNQPRSLVGQCANEVAAQYRPAEHRWYFYGSGHGLAQEQQFYNCIDRRVKEGSSRPAAELRKAMPRRHVVHAAQKRSTEEVLSKSAFSGSESRIAAMNYVNADCSSGPLPEVRIVTPPGSGDLRMEPIKYAVSRDKSNSRAHCNGKIVDAVAVFYRSKSDYVGVDRLVLDVDFKAGTVKRFIYAIDIR